MKWFLGIAVLLVLGLVFHLNLLVFAMYVLGGVLLLGRFLARAWTENLVARRAPVDEVCEIGASIRMAVELENRGRLSVPWILVGGLRSPRGAASVPPPFADERLVARPHPAGARRNKDGF